MGRKVFDSIGLQLVIHKSFIFTIQTKTNMKYLHMNMTKQCGLFKNQLVCVMIK